MKSEKFFLASEDIVNRIGIADTCYRTPKGRYIISSHDLRRVKFHMTDNEFAHGLDVEEVSYAEAQRLISESTLGKVIDNEKERGE